MFFLSYKRADDAVFDDFPKISEHFPKIFEDFPKLFRRPDKCFRTFCEYFRTFSEHFPNISEDCRRQSKKFQRCFDHSPTTSVVEGTKEKCYQT